MQSEEKQSTWRKTLFSYKSNYDLEFGLQYELILINGLHTPVFKSYDIFC